MAAQLTASDLQYRYSTRAVPGDNPKLRGLDSVFFNGEEQYEVLTFVNGFLSNHSIGGNPLTKQHGLKVERMLQKKPGDVRERSKVTQWILDNWGKF